MTNMKQNNKVKLKQPELVNETKTETQPSTNNTHIVFTTNFTDKILFVERKKQFFESVIQKTAIHLQNQKHNDIITIDEYNKYIHNLYDVNKKIKKLKLEYIDETECDDDIDLLQTINNDISFILKENGTESLEDLIKICWGINNLVFQNNKDIQVYELLKEYFHPVNYKIKQLQLSATTPQNSSTSLVSLLTQPSTPTQNQIKNEEMNRVNINCMDIDINSYTNRKSFYMKVFGMQFEISNTRKKIIITGFVDNIIFDLLNNPYINTKQNDILKNIPKSKEFKKQSFHNFIDSLILKDYLIHNITEIYNKFIGYNSQYNLIKQQTMSTLIKDFLKYDLYSKRLTLIQLLIKSTKDDNNISNLACMLYDILSIEIPMNSNLTEKIASKEQLQLYESFPRTIQQFFNEAMINAVKNINSLLKVDVNKIPLEQQISLMNVNDSVKEKAITKWREIKSKSDESATKARQYLEGLLKIPFGIYKKEPIFNVIGIIKEQFNALVYNISTHNRENNYGIVYENLDNKQTTNIVEIINNVKKWKHILSNNLDNKIQNDSFNFDTHKKFILEIIINKNGTKKQFEKCIEKIIVFIKFNIIFKDLKSYRKILDNTNLPVKSITKNFLKNQLIEFIQELFNFDENELSTNSNYNSKTNIIVFISEILLKLDLQLDNVFNTNICVNDNNDTNNNTHIKEDNTIFMTIEDTNESVSDITDSNWNNKEYIINQCDVIESKFNEINSFFSDVKKILDESIYGHENAKRQIERIIGQWINGSNEGYCFGFEGSPGIGKTSMAKKGLANCLKDAYGVSRPFAMIQIGGDSNGSTLHGHNYTYLGSTWGSIVQILMDKQCMNPIIFIDEVDKISKTEHGKELIGILTHLLDPAQNDNFQDKYFNGIDLDLSKALFIVSYNDHELIDRILLDRIHRIKFDNLFVKDKLIIAKNYLLPEIYKKMGLEGMIEIPDDIILYIIEHYTNESGVRKLKERLYEIVGEINLIILKNRDVNIVSIPYKVILEDVKTKFLNNLNEIKHTEIHKCSMVGHINGLWANAYGHGGIMHIQCSYYPSNSFLNLRLTGMQGDVMKESMNVALTLAWKLTDSKVRKKIIKKYNNSLSGIYGIHIHCPEGSTPKDGPSAGGAITAVLYSLFNSLKIKNKIAITGEIKLDGVITAIGGLDLKILGGIRGGVKEFLFPGENEKDFNLFIEKQSAQFYIDLIKTGKTKEGVVYKKYKIMDTEIMFYIINNINEILDLVFEDKYVF
jgi:ATP-dependent Lon protease